MTYQILNGDSLASQLNNTEIEGLRIICRECLIDGPLSGDNLQQFWTTRANYISEIYHEPPETYYQNVASEFEQIINLPEHSEISLWFENDLFCQTNLWFIISLLVKRAKLFKVFRVFPIINNQTDFWKGFGKSNSKMLKKAYLNRIPFTLADMELGNNLWNAYKVKDFTNLIKPSKIKSDCFQYLDQVCKAHIDRFLTNGQLGRPEKTIREIMRTKTSDFKDLFEEFSNREGIYGFGDSQIKMMYDRLIGKS